MLKFLKNAKTLKIAVCFFMVMAAVFLLANFVLAGDLDTGLGYAAQTGLANTDPRVVAARIIRIALGFLGILTLGLIMYAGFLWMTSGGNEDKIEQAKNILKNAIIGLIIILSSFAIASFVLNQLTRATGANVGPNSNSGVSGGGFGAVGSDIVDYTFPANNQENVPRNIGQMSAVLFEQVNPSTFNDKTAEVKAYRVNPTEAPLNKEDGTRKRPLAVWEWLKNLAGEKALAEETPTEGVKVDFEVSADGKILVLKPEEYLGSPKETVWYSVTLKSGIEKANGDKLFPAAVGGVGYNWRFGVGTVIDKTPPKIVSVIPRASQPLATEPRNVVVQINFSEAVDPTSASGQTKNNFKNIQVLDNASGVPVEGNYYISNQYRTVEFLTLENCGLNSCGNAIYCLPGNKELKVFLKAASLAAGEAGLAVFPYDGIVDMAGNSLDGNGNGASQGPNSKSGLAPYNANDSVHANQGDDYFWLFKTNDSIEKTAPEIIGIKPVVNGEIGLDQAPQAVFNKILLSESLNAESVKFKASDQKFFYWVYSANKYDPAVAGQPTTGQTTVYIGHNDFIDKAAYGVEFNQGVKDLYQNCYYPCSGLGIKGNPSCCNGAPSANGKCWQ